MADQRLGRNRRVRHQRDFDRVYATDAFAADQMLVVRGCRNGLDETRLGLSIGRKVGNAVERNVWKRLIREAFRRRRESLPAGLDLVVRPRRGAKPEFTAVMDSLPGLAKRIERRLRKESRK